MDRVEVIDPTPVRRIDPHATRPLSRAMDQRSKRSFANENETTSRFLALHNR